MIKYINRAGKSVEINDTPANIQAAKNAGWTKAKAKKTKKVNKDG